MLPTLASINPYTIQPPLVNTVTPGTTVNHVPYDNVAPSVSSAQIDANARGNSVPTPPSTPPPEAEAAPEESPHFSSALTGSAPRPGSGASATFLAQLVGQDTSPEAQSILNQYEKLVVFGNVRYKPSNAFKPQAEPASVFGRIVHDEKTATRAVEIVPAPAPAQAAQTAASHTILSAQPPVKASKTAANENNPQATDAAEETSPAAPVTVNIRPQAISAAYAATSGRVAAQRIEAVEELV